MQTEYVRIVCGALAGTTYTVNSEGTYESKHVVVTLTACRLNVIERLILNRCCASFNKHDLLAAH